MPHNRTRFWVGLAIIAVTIPAVGTFYTQSAAKGDLRGNPITAAGRYEPASSGQDSFGSGRIALRRPLRDYQSEVAAALARQGVYPDARSEGDSVDDEFFDIDPLDDVQTDSLGSASVREAPDPSTPLAPGNPNLVAYSTDGPVQDTNGAVNTDVAPATASNDSQATLASTTNTFDDYGQTGGTMSDSDIYRLVVNNINGDQRDDFVRAYTAMSAEQRSELLDSFRQQIQGGN